MESLCDIKEEKSFTGHTGWVCGCLYFEKRNLLVTCSWDTRAIVFNTITTETVKVLEDHRNYVLSLVKWDDGHFISAGYSDELFEYSLDNDFKRRTIFSKTDCCFVHIKKLSEDEIICAEYDKGEILIVSYSSGTLIKKFGGRSPESSSLSDWSSKLPGRVYDVHAYAKFEHSKAYKDCVYFNCGNRGDRKILLLHPKMKDPYKSFGGGDLNDIIYAMSIFSNSQNEEILIISGIQPIIYFHNTAIKDQHNTCIRKIEFGGPYSVSQFLFDNQFLFLGKNLGRIDILDLKSPNIGKSIVRKVSEIDGIKVHDSKIYKMILFEVRRHKKEIQIVSVSGDTSVKLLTVSNLQLKDDFVMIDLKERREYLMTEFYEDSQKDESVLNEKVFFTVKTLNENLVILKLLML